MLGGSKLQGGVAAGALGGGKTCHKMFGHKFELRVVVYRDGDVLRAFPSIAKVWGVDSYEIV